MDRFVDVQPKKKKPTLAQGISDALLRRSRSSKAKLNLGTLPSNRQEARRLVKGNGPWMRFKREVDDDGVRRVVRVRL